MSGWGRISNGGMKKEETVRLHEESGDRKGGNTAEGGLRDGEERGEPARAK